MVQITARISLDTRDWIDLQCKEQEFRSYGHSVEKMAVFYRKGHRVIMNLKIENAKLRERVRLYANGELAAGEEESGLEQAGPASYSG